MILERSYFLTYKYNNKIDQNFIKMARLFKIIFIIYIQNIEI